MADAKSINKLFQWYERQPWLRALVQLAPGGGSVDVLLSHRSTKLNQQRIEELIKSVSESLIRIDEKTLDHNFLESDEFFDVSRRCAEVVAHTANAAKRRLVADYLAGTAQTAVIDDLTTQVLEDLNVLQPLHLKIIATLPNQARHSVSTSSPPEELAGMPPEVYEKGVSDLERLGFLRFNNQGPEGGGVRFGRDRTFGVWETTGYLKQFKEMFRH